MSNATIAPERETTTISSGDTYASDPTMVVENEPRISRSRHEKNDFTHVRSYRPLVTTLFAISAIGILALGVFFLVSGISFFAAEQLAAIAVAAGLIGALIGRDADYRSWNYNLAAYTTVGAMFFGTLIVSLVYASGALVS